MNFITTLKQFCEANSNIVNGQKQSDYLKNHFPFYGIPTTKRREILKDALLLHKEEVSTNFRSICWELYQLPQREMHHIAIDIFLKEIKNKYQIEDIVLIEKLLLTNSWWDSVDTLAKYAVGVYLKHSQKKHSKLLKSFLIQRQCG